MSIARTMLEMLTGAYARKDIRNMEKGLPLETNIGRLFYLFGWGIDIIRDHAERIRLWDNMDNAQGAVLDRYGKNFGVRRDGTDDGFYRLMIKVKLLAQLSGGDIDTVIQASAALFGVTPEDIRLEEVFPAKIWIRIDEDLIDAEHMALIDLIAKLNKRILAAGVGMKVILEKEVQSAAHVRVGTIHTISTRIAVPPVSAVGSRSRAGIRAGCCPVEYARLAIRPYDGIEKRQSAARIMAVCAATEFVRVKIPAYKGEY